MEEEEEDSDDDNMEEEEEVLPEGPLRTSGLVIFGKFRTQVTDDPSGTPPSIL